MSRLGVARRYVGLAGTAVGTLAAGAAAGVLTERRLMARRRPSADERFGSLRSDPRIVVADDQVKLYAEIDEPGLAVGTKPPTVVFVHGNALNLDCWHFQRKGLRGRVRLVFYDQRSHGRSGLSRSEHCTLDQLGKDLATVIETLAPDDPVILVGHSMGGMTIMALADQRPDWFGTKVVAAALLSTSAGQLRAGSLNLPGLGGRLAHRVSPAVMATLAHAPRLVETGRRAGSDLSVLFTRAYGFGGPVPREYVVFLDQMLAATPFSVISDFYPGFDEHDRFRALAAFSKVPTLLLCGGKDAVTPVLHSHRIAAELPSAEYVELPGAGHMVLLERPSEVNEAVLRLVQRTEAVAS